MEESRKPDSSSKDDESSSRHSDTSGQSSSPVNFKSVFDVKRRADANRAFTFDMLMEARHTGVVNLTGRGIHYVPDKVFSINVYDEGESTDLHLRPNWDEEELNWWHLEPLALLILKNNSISELPSDIKFVPLLSTLNLESNVLRTLPKEMEKLQNLKDLNLKKNKINNLGDEIFTLKSLLKLTLAYNELEYISHNLSNLNMLQELDLSHNKLKELPPGIGFLTRLINFDLSYNELSEIPPDLVNLLYLKELNIANNKIVELPAMGELRRLQVLYAENNLIFKIPDLNGCAALKKINFENNSISEVSVTTLESLTHITSLNLGGNNLTELSESVSMLKKLERLNISNNKLNDLPKMLGTLPHLTQLQLEGNPLGAIRNDILQRGTVFILRWLREKDGEVVRSQPLMEENIPSPEQLPDRYKMRSSRALCVEKMNLTGLPEQTVLDALIAEVTSVDISKNKFSEIPDGLNILCVNVSELNCGHNILKHVPPFLGKFNHLMYLNLQNNMLTELPQELTSLISLRELDISCNRFKALPNCIYSIKSLEILTANTNCLASLDVKSLSNLEQLATLDVANNNINYVPPKLGNMKQLRNLMLEGNRFRHPRQDILMRGTESILAYLRDKILEY